MEEYHQLSTVDRRKADEKMTRAKEISKEIDALEKEEKKKKKDMNPKTMILMTQDIESSSPLLLRPFSKITIRQRKGLISAAEPDR